jgi:mono/diheme cytochrome c family protein
MACTLVFGLALAAGWAAQAQAQTAAADPYDALAADKAVFEKTCSVCHSLDRPNSKTLDAAGWNAILNNMKMNGAALDDTSRPMIFAWLMAKSTFQTTCSQCHGTDRPLGKSKSRADWTATVQRMAAKKPGHISDADAATIAAYLAIVRPAP